jgi:hypothetical protein
MAMNHPTPAINKPPARNAGTTATVRSAQRGRRQKLKIAAPITKKEPYKAVADKRSAAKPTKNFNSVSIGR